MINQQNKKIQELALLDVSAKSIKEGNAKESFKKFNIIINGEYSETVKKIAMISMFGIILDKCGGCHFRLMCSDGRIRNGKLSGRMANGPRINTGSYVIISLRDFEKDQKT